MEGKGTPRFGGRPGLELRSENKLFLVKKNGLLHSKINGSRVFCFDSDSAPRPLEIQSASGHVCLAIKNESENICFRNSFKNITQ